MARMPSKRWVAMVEKEQWGNEIDGFFLRPEHVAALLARQHAAFVRLVKKLRAEANAKKCKSGDELNIQLGSRYACDDILAALQQGGKK